MSKEDRVQMCDDCGEIHDTLSSCDPVDLIPAQRFRIDALQASNERLKVELEKAKAELEHSRELASGNHRACARLARENDELRTKLAKYGGHTTQCSKNFHPLNTVCDCGFESAPEAKEVQPATFLPDCKWRDYGQKAGGVLYCYNEKSDYFDQACSKRCENPEPEGDSK